jgi:hypothetical protein
MIDERDLLKIKTVLSVACERDTVMNARLGSRVERAIMPAVGIDG